MATTSKAAQQGHEIQETRSFEATARMHRKGSSTWSHGPGDTILQRGGTDRLVDQLIPTSSTPPSMAQVETRWCSVQEVAMPKLPRYALMKHGRFNTLAQLSRLFVLFQDLRKFRCHLWGFDLEYPSGKISFVK